MIGRRGYALLAVAVIVTAGSALIVTRNAVRADSAPRVRTIEPRLSGGTWAPFRSRRVSAPEDEERPATTRGGASPRVRYADGVAALRADRPREALESLKLAARSSADARVWNDLAVAYHETGLRYDVPELLADALAAADRALALDARFAEALFNRALMIERLGLKDDARDAWTAYLAVDAQSGWADDARAHLGTLAPRRPFLEVLDAEYDRIAREPAAAAELYARDPFGARGQGVVTVLGRWGDAVVSRDERAAARHLAVARRLGAVVAARPGGDRMLERAVVAIDAADWDRRLALARAHVGFVAGMKVVLPQPVEAEPQLRAAAAAFEEAGSPMAIVARHWESNSIYDQGRREEAERRTEKALARTPEDYPAYRAFMLWHLGNCRKARADWGAAIARYEESAALFERLGEHGNVANVRGILASLYDSIGDRETAWKNRMAALRDLGIRSDEVQERMVLSIAESSILRREWHTAESFLRLYASVTRRLDYDFDLAAGLLLRALVRDRVGDAAGLRADLAEAKAMISRMTDAAHRTRLGIAELRTRAMLRATPPAEADTLLTPVIEYHRSHGHPNTVPGLLLARARARRAAGNRAGALEDVERGIAELERNRESLPEGESRWGAFHSAEELFEEAIDLALEADDASEAFRFAEKARARALLEAYGRSPAIDVRALPPRTTVVEYAALPSRLVIFIADVKGVHAETVSVERETLADAVAESTRLVRGADRAAFIEGASRLHRTLIAPIAPRIADAETIVFVPNAATSTVPFAALANANGEPLVVRHRIVCAPSAAAFAAADERRREVPHPQSVLVLSASEAAAGSGKLPFVRREAERIAAMYRSATHVREEEAQFDELIARAADADVIHFGGHGVGDDRGYEPASIVMRQNGRERRMRAGEIAKLGLRRTSVVVLAGCNTARGERRAAEGAISVAHGFLSAGAPAVIATLWPIDDESAARFFPRLHRRIAAGMRPADALRETQIEAIRLGIAPSLWAAVQGIGS